MSKNEKVGIKNDEICIKFAATLTKYGEWADVKVAITIIDELLHYE